MTLAEDGFAVIPDLLDHTSRAALSAATDELLASVGWGDNDFDGRRTKRVHGLLGRSRAFDPLLDPAIRDRVTGTLGWPHQLGMLFITEVHPGERQQSLHFDAGVYPLPRALECELNLIYAVTDFTADNGATVVIPGSQLWPDGRRPTPRDERRSVVMAAGSALLYSGRLWHGAGANTSDVTRRAVIVEHVLPWLRPADNHTLSTPLETLTALPDELAQLAGVGPAGPYFGFIAGRDPLTWLRSASPEIEQRSQ